MTSNCTPGFFECSYHRHIGRVCSIERCIELYDQGLYERFECVLPRIICNYDKSKKSTITLRPNINTRLIEILLETGHQCQLNESIYNMENDIVTIMNNYRLLSHPNPIVILHSNPMSHYMIQYCQIAMIPYQLRLDDRYDVCSDWINKLTIDDINDLDEDGRRVIQTACIDRDNIKEGYIIHLLQQMSYPNIGKRIRLRHSAIRTGKILKNKIRSQFDKLRLDINNISILTHPTFNNNWRRLNSVEILHGFFDPEHLISLGITVPHVDLLSDYSILMNTAKLKLLIPYSTPTSLLMYRIIGRSNSKIYHMAELLVIVRYRRECLLEYRHIPLVDHLLNISDRGRTTKNANSVI